MVSSEDFSFPEMTSPLPHLAISPSLWRVSSLVYPDCREKDGGRELDIISSKSFSFAASEVKMESSEEKMDMLWENFNEEELLRVSSTSLGSKKQHSDDSLDSEPGRGVNQLCCAKKELKMPKSEKNISLISAPAQHKRHSVVVMFKHLKKIFLLRSSSSDPTKNHKKNCKGQNSGWTTLCLCPTLIPLAFLTNKPLSGPSLGESVAEEREMDLESVKRYLETGGFKDDKNASTIEEMPFRFFEKFIMQGLHVDLIEPGRVVCSMKVPPRLLNGGNFLHGGATATLVDLVGSAAMFTVGAPVTGVSVEINVSYLDAAFADEEIEIESRVLRVGKAVGVVTVELKKKKTGKIVAQGRHTKYLAIPSKM
ncbi:unnamed protein product [Dovyalis caffra]|uniref:Thioesterase domain-containing protein n=1 Tax=Dovyalis caffra TaxID=77055 RepID=A0AAV1R6F1_9ROSI|nr:unnamed protein product [Dovyalis caffra]